MIIYDDGSQITITIDKKILPIAHKNFKGLSIKEDMAAFFVSGKLIFTDIMGVFSRDIIIKGSEIIEISIFKKKVTEVMKFSISEVLVFEDISTVTNTVHIVFMTLGYGKVLGKRHSRGFGQTSGSSVVLDIMSSSFSGMDVDPSGDSVMWVQPYYSNKKMVKYISKKVFSSFSGLNDYVYYTTRDNVFYFKSLSKLMVEPKLVTISNKSDVSNKLFIKSTTKNRATLYEALGGAGTVAFYFVDSLGKYMKDGEDLRSIKVKDSASNLGKIPPTDDIPENGIFDEGIVDSVNIPMIRAEADARMLDCIALTKNREVYLDSYEPSLSIGKIIELEYYVGEKEMNREVSGKYLLTYNELTADHLKIKTNLGMFRMGFNNGVGRRLG